MESLELEELALSLNFFNKQMKQAEAGKILVIQVLNEHWKEAVISELNGEIKQTGYFFHDETISFVGSGQLQINLYPCPYPWWTDQDEHHGWTDFARADRLALLVNATETVKKLKGHFPDLVIRVQYSFSGYFDSTVEGDDA